MKTVISKMKLFLIRILHIVVPTFIRKRHWEKRGGTYHDEQTSRAYKEMYEYLADFCLKEHPKRILEYGCGYGHLLKKISDINCGKDDIEYYGIDFSSTQIENAKKYFSDGKFYVGDITKLLKNFEDNYFDVVIGVGVLMYLQKKDISKAILELKRVCKNKVYIVEYYYKYLAQEKQDAYKSVIGLDGRDIYDYEELLLNNGFKDVQIKHLQQFSDKEINVDGEMAQTLVVGSI